ncbi:hypothetical protein PIB30_004671 [Stylosanthes scabra]|uniref:Clathrin/coatomer adaptor adaptin-like N-terminal domain-containing protein n=1 Tax=Stylosanthes scabra TaxID=79078 RepID=A0ABU6Q3M9_9FABA|nr:hypothetical protein [Stylosanthes scabra]
MRALQYFPTVEDPNTRSHCLRFVLQRILIMGTDVVKNVNKNNASHAVLFEAVALVMHVDAERETMTQCVSLLGKFISENMTRMLMVTDVQRIIKKHLAQIITSLKDPDISIRRRALDLVYGMCDISNAKDIVEELLQYLKTAEFAMREELSLKAAILAEKFALDLSWYVDVILQFPYKAVDFVSDDIWFRFVQFVTNNEDLQLIFEFSSRRANSRAWQYVSHSLLTSATVRQQQRYRRRCGGNRLHKTIWTMLLLSCECTGSATLTVTTVALEKDAAERTPFHYDFPFNNAEGSLWLFRLILATLSEFSRKFRFGMKKQLNPERPNNVVVAFQNPRMVFMKINRGALGKLGREGGRATEKLPEWFARSAKSGGSNAY